ncbi:MAG: diphthine--ammonia ligase [Candidatus Firestonebacteria bacterium]
MDKRFDRNAVSSWSGGKDSCLALYKAVKEGYEVKALLNFASRDMKRCCFHGISDEIIKLQGELIGIPVIKCPVTDDMKNYEKEFKESVKSVKGIDSMIFGDIFLQEHLDWIVRVCKDIGISPVEPLWGLDVNKIAEEFVDLGFKTIIISAQAGKLGKEFVGRVFDKILIEDLKKAGVCPCGENGEFHTLVIDGPIFKRPINIKKTETIFKKGFWDHWFLDIKEYQ